jgi:hypothetical protein
VSLVALARDLYGGREWARNGGDAHYAGKSVPVATLPKGLSFVGTSAGLSGFGGGSVGGGSVGGSDGGGSVYDESDESGNGKNYDGYIVNAGDESTQRRRLPFLPARDKLGKNALAGSGSSITPNKSNHKGEGVLFPARLSFFAAPLGHQTTPARRRLSHSQSSASDDLLPAQGLYEAEYFAMLSGRAHLNALSSSAPETRRQNKKALGRSLSPHAPPSSLGTRKRLMFCLFLDLPTRGAALAIEGKRNCQHY